MMKFIHDILTEPDNKTFCIIKSLAATGAFAIIGLGISTMIKNHSVDFIGFGTAYAAILGAAGAGTKWKKDTPIDNSTT